MATDYVGSGGSDGAAGTAWATRSALGFNNSMELDVAFRLRQVS